MGNSKMAVAAYTGEVIENSSEVWWTVCFGRLGLQGLGHWGFRNLGF